MKQGFRLLKKFLILLSFVFFLSASIFDEVSLSHICLACTINLLWQKLLERIAKLDYSSGKKKKTPESFHWRRVGFKWTAFGE